MTRPATNLNRMRTNNDITNDIEEEYVTSFQHTAVSEMMASTTLLDTLKASRMSSAGSLIGVSRGRHRLKMEIKKSD